jgi:hypothetical protein
MGPNSIAQIASRIVARNTRLAPLELATGFELPNMQRRKNLPQLRLERQTLAPRYLNMILNLQFPSLE